MAHAADERTSGRRFSSFHAGPRESHYGYTARVELRIEVERLVADTRRHADTLAEIGEMKHHAQYAAVEWLALVRVDRITDAQHAADIQHLDDVARLHRRRHVAGVAEQRLTMAERAYDDVALANLRHAAAGQLERVIGRLVVEDLDDHDDAFLGGNIRGDAYFVREAARLRD